MLSEKSNLKSSQSIAVIIFFSKEKITQQFADSIYSNCDTQPFNQVFDIMTIEPLGVALGPPCQHFS